MNEKAQQNTIREQNLELKSVKSKISRTTIQVRVSTKLHPILRASAQAHKTTMSKAIDRILSEALVHGEKEIEVQCPCGFVNRKKVYYSDFSLNKTEIKILNREKSNLARNNGISAKNPFL